MYMCIYILRLKWFNFEMYMNAKLTRVGLLMGNFICQFDWATGYLDICSNIILGVSVRASTDEMNSWRDRLSKADCPPLKKKKEFACNAWDPGSIPESGRFPGAGNGNPLQYSRLENPIDRGAWQATGHGVIRIGHDLVTKERDRYRKILIKFAMLC